MLDKFSKALIYTSLSIVAVVLLLI